MKQLNVFWGLLCGPPHCLLRRAKPMRRPLTAGILILALVAQSGCASSGTDKRSALDLLPPPPGEAVLKVAVTSGRFAPEFDIIDSNLPSSLKWQLFTALSIFVVGPIFLISMVTGIFPAAIEIMDAYEVGKESANERAKQVAERKAALREVVAGQSIQDDLRDRVIAIGRTRTLHTFTVLAGRGPSAPGEQPDYRPLSQEAIQAVLEIVVESVTLDGMDDIPDRVFRLMMIVNRRLVRTLDNGEISANTRTYYGKSWRSMEEWVGDLDGFGDELNRVYAEIAERTVEEVFLRTESN